MGRVWGKALQTDAPVSPNNYGGPLVDIRGRVMGLLVPLSPQSAEEIAGVEWYDSGIGFAMPLEAIQKVLPKLRKGEDLYYGRGRRLHAIEESLHGRHRDRLLPAELARRQGPVQGRRPHRRDRRPQGRPIG